MSLRKLMKFYSSVLACPGQEIIEGNGAVNWCKKYAVRFTGLSAIFAMLDFIIMFIQE